MQVLAADLVLARPSTLGEGSLWDPARQLLYWVDIYQNQVFAYDPHQRTNLAYDVGANVGTVVPATDGSLIVALRNQVARLNPQTGQVSRLVVPEQPRSGMRLNDGKCDPEGRFWVGSMVESGPPNTAALYRIDPDLTVSRQLDGLSISNGLVWHADRFYHIDSPPHELCSYRYEAQTGQISERRVVRKFQEAEGTPDGMCIDEQGMLWVALFGGGGVVRVDPSSGQVDLKVEVPASQATSCALGGEQLDELYITTARVGCSAEQLTDEPLAGSLFRAKVPTRGVPAVPFAGPA